MKKTEKNKLNLIYFALDNNLTKYLKELLVKEQEESKNTNSVFSKKFNTSQFKTRTFDKVSTPFIEMKLFKDEK